jgi:hypothetical protein
MMFFKSSKTIFFIFLGNALIRLQKKCKLSSCNNLLPAVSIFCNNPWIIKFCAAAIYNMMTDEIFMV